MVKKLNADNQTYVIVFMGLALLMSIYFQQNEAIITGLSGALAGMFMGKTMNEHQTELIDEQLILIIKETIREVLAAEGYSGGGSIDKT